MIDVARRQRNIGIDVINDGEFGKATRAAIDYGAWQSYAYERLSGWEPGPGVAPAHSAELDQGRAVPHAVGQRKERHRARFADFSRELAQTTPTSRRAAAGAQGADYQGVVSHATNVVEHPEVVADRILRFASVVGSERVIASTDCGVGARIHPSIAWAKLEALVEGAALASRQLYAKEGGVV